MNDGEYLFSNSFSFCLTNGSRPLKVCASLSWELTEMDLSNRRNRRCGRNGETRFEKSRRRTTSAPLALQEIKISFGNAPRTNFMWAMHCSLQKPGSRRSNEAETPGYTCDQIRLLTSAATFSTQARITNRKTGQNSANGQCIAQMRSGQRLARMGNALPTRNKSF